MRIVAIAGLNLSAADQISLQEMRQAIVDSHPDMLLLAGDTGNPPEEFDRVLAMFAELPCAKGVVAGNRDLWSVEGKFSSQQLWAEILPEIAQRHGYIWLEHENLVVGNVGVCGSVGWYDYSARDVNLGYTLEQYAELKGLVNDDAKRLDWGVADPEFAEQLQDGFSARLDALESDRDIDHVIVVTHMPVFAEAVVHNLEDAKWNFGAAYAFNLTLGRLIAPKTKIRHVVSGHTTQGGEWIITFGRNRFRSTTIGRNGDAAGRVVIDL